MAVTTDRKKFQWVFDRRSRAAGQKGRSRLSQPKAPADYDEGVETSSSRNPQTPGSTTRTRSYSAVFPSASRFTSIIAGVSRPCSPAARVLSMTTAMGLPSGSVIRHTVLSPKTWSGAK